MVSEWDVESAGCIFPCYATAAAQQGAVSHNRVFNATRKVVAAECCPRTEHLGSRLRCVAALSRTQEYSSTSILSWIARVMLVFQVTDIEGVRHPQTLIHAEGAVV